jgi:hypothetical protein
VAQHILSQVVPVGPSGPGALAGFEVRCSCGYEMRSSLESCVRLDSQDHVAWEADKAARLAVVASWKGAGR